MPAEAPTPIAVTATGAQAGSTAASERAAESFQKIGRLRIGTDSSPAAQSPYARVRAAAGREVRGAREALAAFSLGERVAGLSRRAARAARDAAAKRIAIALARRRAGASRNSASERVSVSV